MNQHINSYDTSPFAHQRICRRSRAHYLAEAEKGPAAPMPEIGIFKVKAPVSANNERKGNISTQQYMK